MFQFTPPHRGHQARIPFHLVRLPVSIHAPAQGASSTVQSLAKSPIVSIHAPAQGASGYEFNMIQYGKVSIHAPAQGASNFHKGFFALSKFQFTPPHRGHLYPRKLISLWVKFQFTPPHRGHPAIISLLPSGKKVSIHAPAQGASKHEAPFPAPRTRFNSRPRTGGIDKNRQITPSIFMQTI